MGLRTTAAQDTRNDKELKLASIAPAYGDLEAKGRWKAFSALALGLLFGVMDFGGVSVAVPSIAHDLTLTLSTASWVVLASSLTISAVLLPVGGVSDMMDRRRMYVLGGALFVCGAFTVGAAPSLLALMIGRVVEALGAAVVMANGMAIAASLFPKGQRGRGMGLIAMFVGFGAVAGPVVAGTVVEQLGWRAFFYLVGAGASVALVWAWLTLDEVRVCPPSERSFRGYDWAGAILSGGALTVLVLLLTFGNRLGWGSAVIIVAIIATVVLFAMFWVRELTTPRPMLNLAMFRDIRLASAISARYLGFLGSSAWAFLMPFYLQDVLGMDPGDVGLVMAPAAVAFTLFAAFSGRLSDEWGTKRFAVAGLLAVGFAELLFAFFDQHTSLALIVFGLFLNGAGMGLWVAPNMSAVINRVDSSKHGVASALMNLARNTGSMTSIAMATAVVASVMVTHGGAADLSALAPGGTGNLVGAFLSGSHYAYLVLAGCAMLAAAASTITGSQRDEPDSMGEI